MKKFGKILIVSLAALGFMFTSCSVDSGNSHDKPEITPRDELDGKILKNERHLTTAGGYTLIDTYTFNDGLCEYTREQRGDEGSTVTDMVSRHFIYEYSFDKDSKVLSLLVKKQFVGDLCISTPQAMTQHSIDSVSDSEILKLLTSNGIFTIDSSDKDSFNNYHSYFEESMKKKSELDFSRPFYYYVEEIEGEPADSAKRNVRQKKPLNYGVVPLNFPEALGSYNNTTITVENTKDDSAGVVYTLLD